MDCTIINKTKGHLKMDLLNRDSLKLSVLDYDEYVHRVTLF